MAMLLIALLASLQGAKAQAPAEPRELLYGQAATVTRAPAIAAGTVKKDAATGLVTYPDLPCECTADQQCPATCSGGTVLVPTLRGLCVGGTSCWDACNAAHLPTDYSVANKAGIALMIKQLRTGMRAGSCPGATYTPTCNPGERCTPAGLTWGRGMCITMAGKGNQCLDMCDTKIALDTFHDTPGKQAGTIGIVEQVRAGRDPAGFTTCPGPSVWLWLWIPLSLCCVIGFCALAYYMFNYYRGRLKRYREPVEQPAYVDEQGYVSYDQGMPQPQDATDLQQMAPGQDEPMPVIDQPMVGGAMPVIEQPAVLEPQTVAAGQNLFGGEPNLMAGLQQPQTVITPQAAGLYPQMAAPMTAYTPQLSTVQMAGQPTMASRPVYGGQSMTMGGSVLSTGIPSYSAYGAYGTTYPTGSMRIG